MPQVRVPIGPGGIGPHWSGKVARMPDIQGERKADEAATKLKETPAYEPGIMLMIPGYSVSQGPGLRGSLGLTRLIDDY